MLADYGLKPGSAVGQEIDADTTGGRSKCMPARPRRRPGRGGPKRQLPVSDAASRKIHSRAERRRRSASEAVVVAVCFAHGSHVLAHGAAGAVKRPVVPHAPSGKKEQEMTGKPWGRTRHGAMTRACV